MSTTIRKIAIAAGSVLAVGVLGTGVAAASGPSTATAPPPAVTTAAVVAPSDTPEPAGTPEKAEVPGSEAPETASDGPGGHADPAGNLDHQFEGVE